MHLMVSTLIHSDDGFVHLYQDALFCPREHLPQQNSSPAILTWRRPLGQQKAFYVLFFWKMRCLFPLIQCAI